MQAHRSRSRFGRHSPLLAITALTLTLVSSLTIVNSADASWRAPFGVSGVRTLSRTNYGSVPVGSSLDGYWSQPRQKRQIACMYVDDPLGQRGTVQRIEVQPGDASSGGERAEVIISPNSRGFQDGETIVMSWGVMIDSTFASPPGHLEQLRADTCNRWR